MVSDKDKKLEEMKKSLSDSIVLLDKISFKIKKKTE
jgi:hypothetical protein